MGQRCLPNAREAAIAEEYLAGSSAQAVARANGLTHAVVMGALRRQGVPRRKHTRNRQVDEAVFDDAAGSEAAAYFVGLLMADGCVQRHRAGATTVSLALAGDDRFHVDDYRDFLRSTHALIDYAPGRGQRVRKVCVASDRLALALARYGVLPHKSFAARVRLLEDNAHFWRGMICGDGGLTISPRCGPMIYLCGSRDNMDLFLAFCRSVTSTNATVYPHYTIWQTRFSGRHACRIVEAIFGPATVALPRKWEAARAILKFAGEKHERGSLLRHYSSFN